MNLAVVPDPLGAELESEAAWTRQGPHSAPESLAGFEQRHRRAGRDQPLGCGEAGQSGADYQGVHGGEAPSGGEQIGVLGVLPVHWATYQQLGMIRRPSLRA